MTDDEESELKIGLMFGQSDYFVYLCSQKVFSAKNTSWRNVFSAENKYFANYRQFGYYPFFLEGKQEYYDKVENVINYIVDVELPKHRGFLY